MGPSTPPARSDLPHWVQLVTAGLITVATSGLPGYAGTLLIAQMAKDLSFSRTQLGLIISTAMVFTGALSFVAGMLIKRFGARLAFASGGAMIMLGSSVLATQHVTWMGAAMTFGALVAGATAIGGAIPGVTIVSRWFEDRRALAMTLLFCMMSLGGAAGVAVVNWIGGPQHDWRAGWWLLTGCAAAAIILALAVIRDTPQSVGLAPLRLGSARFGSATTATTGKPLPIPHSQLEISVREAMGSPIFWAVLFSIAGAYSAMGLVIAHGYLNLLDLGLSSAQAASVLGIFPVAALVGKASLAVVGDRFDPRIVGGIGTFGSGLGLLGMTLSSSYPIALVAVFLIGFGMGSATVTVPLVLAARFGKGPFTILMATVQGAQTTIAAMVAFVTGFVYDAGAGYPPVFLSCGACCGIAGLALIAVRPVRASSAVPA